MWGALAGAAIGALSGSQKDNAEQTSGLRLAPASEAELAGGRAAQAGLGGFGSLVGMGPGAQDVQASQGSNQALRQMLSQYAKGGFLPSEGDWGTANQFAQSAFAPQQLGMQQAFQGQQQRTAQLAAQMGRPTNDPILQAKLAQEQMQGQERLGAAQGAYASQYAQQLPQQRLGYTAQLADINNNLASQAMANRQALMSMGQSVQGAERNFRLQSAERYGSTSSGGGLKGAISGGIAGLGAGMALGKLFGGGDTGTGMGAPNAGPQVPEGWGSRAASAAGAGLGAMQSFSGPQQQYNIPPALQPPSFQNSLTMANPQFNAFGQMGGGQAPPMSFASPQKPLYNIPAGQPMYNPFGFYTP